MREQIQGGKIYKQIFFRETSFTSKLDTLQVDGTVG